MVVNPLSPQNSTLSVLQTGAGSISSGTKAGLPDSADALVALVEGIDPAQGEDLRKELSQLDEALQNLDEALKDPEELRKAAAKDKIARIKTQLAGLRLLASANPEAAATQAQRLARELAAAAREYANAGGGSIDAGAGAASVTIPIAATKQTSAKEQSGPVDPIGAAAETGDAAAVAPDAGDATVRAAVQAQFAETNKLIAAQEADADFARDVRRVLNSLKNTIDVAKKKLHFEEGDPSNPRIAEAENALRGMEHALSQISPGGGLAKGGVNIAV